MDDNPFRYCGEYYDKETKTIYLRARYYNPAQGRFTQQDGWEYANPNDPLSLNLYTYCWNKPISYVDPSGHFVSTLIGVATGGTINGIKAIFSGRDVYKSIRIGEITGGISGIGVDLGALLSAAGLGVLAPVVTMLFGALASATGYILDKMWIDGLTWDEIDKEELLAVTGIGAIFGAIFGAVSYGLGEILSLVWPTSVTGDLLEDLVNMLVDCGLDQAIASSLLNFAFVALPQTATETIVTESE